MKKSGVIKFPDGTIQKGGIHRSAYAFNTPKEKCVVKIPRRNDTESYSANIAEIETWKKMPKKMKKYFLPIDDFDKTGEFLTQTRVITLREMGIHSSDSVVQKFDEQLQNKGISCHDLHTNNLGIEEKYEERNITPSKIKILDYGFGVSCRIKGKEQSLSDIYDIQEKKSKRQARKSSSTIITPELFAMFGG